MAAPKVSIITTSTSRPVAATPTLSLEPNVEKVLVHNKDASIAVNVSWDAADFGVSYSADEGFILIAGAAVEVRASGCNLFIRAASGTPKVQVIQQKR